VTDHFTVAGELYERQGAGWAIDVIVVDGRKHSRGGDSCLSWLSVQFRKI